MFFFFYVHTNFLQAVTNLDDVFSTDDIEKLQSLSQSCNADEVVKIKVSDTSV